MAVLEATVAGSVGLAAGLGLGGWRSARACRAIEQACPPLGSFVESPTGRLHYVERGSGPPVVLIHGASANLRDLSLSLLEPLARTCRVLAFDRPGYGYSARSRGAWLDPRGQAASLYAALETLGVREPLLVGHSWGASLVLAYALEFPEHVSGVVTVAGASHPWPGGVALYRTLGATPVAGPLLASTLIWPFGRRMADAAIRATFHPDVPPDGYRERAGIDLLFRPAQFLADAQDVTHLCGFLRQQSTRYPKIRVPLTIVTGTRDRIVSPGLHSRALHAEVPHSRLVVLEGAGHALHHGQRDLVAREIERMAHGGDER